MPLVVGTNSWISVHDADAYFADKYGASAWFTLGADKDKLLITAFNWIRQQNDFDIALSSTAPIVKQAQCEAAWFIYKYFDDYEEQRALAASGVKSYRELDTAVSLEKVEFPSFLALMLADFSLSIGASFPRVHRDLEQNGSV